MSDYYQNDLFIEFHIPFYHIICIIWYNRFYVSYLFWINKFITLWVQYLDWKWLPNTYFISRSINTEANTVTIAELLMTCLLCLQYYIDQRKEI